MSVGEDMELTGQLVSEVVFISTQFSNTGVSDSLFAILLTKQSLVDLT